MAKTPAKKEQSMTVGAIRQRLRRAQVAGNRQLVEQAEQQLKEVQDAKQLESAAKQAAKDNEQFSVIQPKKKSSAKRAEKKEIDTEKTRSEMEESAKKKQEEEVVPVPKPKGLNINATPFTPPSHRKVEEEEETEAPRNPHWVDDKTTKYVKTQKGYYLEKTNAKPDDDVAMAVEVAKAVKLSEIVAQQEAEKIQTQEGLGNMFDSTVLPEAPAQAELDKAKEQLVIDVKASQSATRRRGKGGKVDPVVPTSVQPPDFNSTSPTGTPPASTLNPYATPPEGIPAGPASISPTSVPIAPPIDPNAQPSSSQVAQYDPNSFNEQRAIEDTSVQARYHKDAILLFFGSLNQIEWDIELEKNVKSLKWDTTKTNKAIDSIISKYQDKFQIYNRISNGDINEYLELVQLQFCWQRNMQRGSRSKQAMVPLSSLMSFGNKLAQANGSGLTTGVSQPPPLGTPENPYRVGTDTQQVGCKEPGCKNGKSCKDCKAKGKVDAMLRITPNQARENIIKAFDARKADWHGRPLMNEDITKATVKPVAGTLVGINDPEDPMNLITFGIKILKSKRKH